MNVSVTISRTFRVIAEYSPETTLKTIFKEHRFSDNLPIYIDGNLVTDKSKNLSDFTSGSSCLISQIVKTNNAANLSPDRTGLPYAVWLDECGMRRGHSIHRLKYGDNRELSVTFLNKGCYEIKGSPKLVKIRDSEIKILKKWIDKNYKLLEKLATGQIDIVTFEANMIKE